MGYFDSVDKFVSLRAMVKAMALAALLSTLAACGGSGDAPASSSLVPAPAPAPAPPSPPEAVTGVAIPSNVSVVTANNAG